MSQATIATTITTGGSGSSPSGSGGAGGGGGGGRGGGGGGGGGGGRGGGGGTPPPAAAPAAPAPAVAPNGAFKTKIPAPFNGGRKGELTTFLQKWEIFRNTNHNHPTMTNAYDQCCFFFTLLDGPAIDNW